MTTAAGCMSVVTSLLALDVPLILDADALNCLASVAIGGIDATPELYRREAPLIMTPHTGELARLVDEESIDDLRLGHRCVAAYRLGCRIGRLVVVAKGPTTAIVGCGEGAAAALGPRSACHGGLGRRAAGIIAGTMALNHEGVEAWELLAAYAVMLHSYTGFAAAERWGEKSVIATDLIDLIGDAMRLATDEVLGGLEGARDTADKEA